MGRVKELAVLPSSRQAAWWWSRRLRRSSNAGAGGEALAGGAGRGQGGQGGVTHVQHKTLECITKLCTTAARSACLKRNKFLVLVPVDQFTYFGIDKGV